MVKLLQFSNIDSIFITFNVLKWDRSNVIREVQSWNKLFINNTDEVSNELKSNVNKEEHDWNIEPILINKWVCLKLLNCIDFKAEQPLNILFIVVTTEWSKLAKLILVKVLQSSNIWLKSVISALNSTLVINEPKFKYTFIELLV